MVLCYYVSLIGIIDMDRVRAITFMGVGKVSIGRTGFNIFAAIYFNNYEIIAII